MAIRGRPLRLHEPHPMHDGLTIGQGIVRDIRDGLFKADACARAGISTSTLIAWMDRGASQDERVFAFYMDAHPDALDCDHRFTRGTCSKCGTGEQTWADLVASDEVDGDCLDLLREVNRASANVKAFILAAILSASQPVKRLLLRDDDGEIVRDEAGDPVSYMPGRPDYRAGAWLLERLSPLDYYLQLRSQDAEVEHEPEPLPAIVMDEIDQIAERLGTFTPPGGEVAPDP